MQYRSLIFLFYIDYILIWFGCPCLIQIPLLMHPDFVNSKLHFYYLVTVCSMYVYSTSSFVKSKQKRDGEITKKNRQNILHNNLFHNVIMYFTWMFCRIYATHKLQHNRWTQWWKRQSMTVLVLVFFSDSERRTEQSTYIWE